MKIKCSVLDRELLFDCDKDAWHVLSAGKRTYGTVKGMSAAFR